MGALSNDFVESVDLSGYHGNSVFVFLDAGFKGTHLRHLDLEFFDPLSVVFSIGELVLDNSIESLDFLG